MSYIQGQVREAKEAVESARAGLSPQKGDVRKKREEKKKTKEGGLATRRGCEKNRNKRKEKDQGRQEGVSSEGKVPCARNQEFLLFGSRIFGF